MVSVYATDGREPEKHEHAKRLLAQLMGSGRGAISTQVMQEYAAVVVGKLRQVPSVVVRQLATFEHSFEVVQVTPALVRQAVELQTLYQLSFWDACIIAAAESARCDVIYSEDLNAGQFYAGIRLVNPFEAA